MSLKPEINPMQDVFSQIWSFFSQVFEDWTELWNVWFLLCFQCWTEHVWLFLCCSGTVRHEKRVFSRLVLDLAYSYFLPPFSFQIRVGGLYLLYSLYQCQTASPPEQVRTSPPAGTLHEWSREPEAQWTITFLWLQIRVALKDWDEVMKFEKDAADAQHLDAVYILRQLMFLKAFHFTATPRLVSWPPSIDCSFSLLLSPSSSPPSSSSSSCPSSPLRRRGRWRSCLCARSSLSERVVRRSWSTATCWRSEQRDGRFWLQLGQMGKLKNPCFFCRSCPTSTSSMRRWRRPSLCRRKRPSTWSTKASSLSCAALSWVSTNGSRTRWEPLQVFASNEDLISKLQFKVKPNELIHTEGRWWLRVRVWIGPEPGSD